ncbi:WXG100 family type VII secretion target [Lentzea jiangxiensis]|uniref:ESAT-6-like protein n=1 Tax=Lentzea jiangxiensis TaxID=641025 RepID=A0A1H0X3H3_9PSEU|nr:WXG100 family type VII secretion target [Lentzea jiangxiensis]SDP97462.1 WXG100 family type VII secretion target [Lentzea jiangxiensis]
MSLPEGFSVHSSIPEVANEMDRQTKLIRDALDELERLLTPMKATWTGEGATAYDSVQKQWDAASLNMANRFGVASQTMNEAFVHYKRVDNSTNNDFLSL